MALRSTYDTGVFGSGLYGEPETTQFSATVALGVSVTASANVIKGGSATASTAFTTNTPSSDIIKDASATASSLTVVTAAALSYVESEGFRSGYGLGLYGDNVYGENYSIEAGTATANIAVSATASSTVIRQVSGSAAVAVTTAAHAVFDVVGRASPTISISPDIAYNRVRLMSASDDIGFTPDVNARYKWLDADDPTTIWTDASEPSTTWADADYLERAA